MSESVPNRITVMRSLTRKRGDEYEKVLVGAEANLASGVTLEEALADLNQTVLLALHRATETSATEPSRELPAQTTSGPSSPSREPPTSTSQEASTITSVDGKKKLAALYGDKSTLRVVVNPDVVLKAQAAPITGFLIPRVLEAMIARDKELKVSNPLGYEIKSTNDGQRLVEMDVQNITDERRMKELVNAIQWTLRRLAEKR